MDRAMLASLTKEKLIRFFPSLNLKMASSKDDLIAQILSGNPTSDEIRGLEIYFDKEPEPEPRFIVVYPIQEDGRLFERGSQYTGRFAEKFLRDGQIKDQ